jgi:hypothetical protein
MEGRGGLRSVGGIVLRGWKKDEGSGESLIGIAKSVFSD